MPLFDPSRLLVIAGPCSLEGEAVVRAVASELSAIAARRPLLQVVFKGSFDKANRTSLRGCRGTGLEEGLRLLGMARSLTGFPILTDVHERDQVAAVAAVVDVIQIPAFLCRQTDLLLAAGGTGRVVNVKKGQFLAPSDMVHTVEKVRAGGGGEVWLTERGTTFGYNNLVVDMRAFPQLARAARPVIIDATHGVQLPGGAGDRSGGQREFAPLLARAALAAGADGIFLETHPDPDHALSDGPNMIPLGELDLVLEACLRVWRAVR